MLSATMSGLAPHRREQKRPAGDRLQSRFGISQPHKQAPPVVDQRHRQRREPTACQVLGGETAPAPLVLQLIEGVLGISPVAVQLGDC